MMVGKITYSYQPKNWSQEEFLRLGGFTVVFLNYNKAAYIEKSVASALAQDFPLCEMFFMDDASTDGSGDTMESLVREYRGRHRVMVVRNTKNLSTCGQWERVLKLSSGRWFGMFCADDFAHSDRVSVTARLVAEYPSAWGVCTNADVAGGGRFHSSSERCVWSGDPQTASNVYMFGAMTFWRREALDIAMPFCSIDDYFIQWTVMIRQARANAPVLVMAYDLSTVDYSLGGITNNQHQGLDSRSWIIRTFRRGRADYLLGKKVGYNVWQWVDDFVKTNGADSEMAGIVRGRSYIMRMKSAGAWARLKLLVLIHTRDRMDSFGGSRRHVVNFVHWRFCEYALGLPGYVAFHAVIPIVRGLVRGV